MRSFSPFVLDRLSQDTVETFSLLAIRNDLFLSTLSYDVTYDGQEFISDIGILDFSPPVQSSNVDRETFRFTISDPLGAVRTTFQGSPSGQPIKTYLAFFNPDGTPNLELDNVIVAYEGTVDKVFYSNDFDEAIVTLEASSPMSALNLVRTLITSRDGMDQLSLTDTSFDNVIETNETSILWGKMPATTSNSTGFTAGTVVIDPTWGP